jgi:hypothetical protein
LSRLENAPSLKDAIRLTWALVDQWMVPLRSTSTTLAMSCMGIMLAVREAIPKARDLAIAEFATLRLRLIKIAARVIETASRCGSPSPPHVQKPI